MNKTFIIINLFVLFIFLNIQAETICIDPGHGGSDPGTSGYSPPPYEKDVNLEFALEFEYTLGSYYFTSDIYITRDDDYFVSLDDRVAIANGQLVDARNNTAPSNGTDEFLSIHCNGSTNQSIHGTECYVWTNPATNTPPTNTDHFQFASAMITSYINWTIWEYLNAQIATYGGELDGIRGANYQVLREVWSRGAILLEMEFLTSDDAYYPLSDWYHYYDYSYLWAAVDGMVEACNNFSPVINSVEPGKHAKKISGFYLYENYPNPFNPSSTIKYDIEKASTVELEIYNTNGQLIKTINKEYKIPGSYSAVWDGTNNHGHSVASGTYICRLRAGDYRKSIKLSLLR